MEAHYHLALRVGRPTSVMSGTKDAPGNQGRSHLGVRYDPTRGGLQAASTAPGGPARGGARVQGKQLSLPRRAAPRPPDGFRLAPRSRESAGSRHQTESIFWLRDVSVLEHDNGARYQYEHDHQEGEAP